MGLMLLALLLTSPGGFADQDECMACCRAGGLDGCRPSLNLVGQGSSWRADMGGWRAQGLWRLQCNGTAWFDPAAHAVFADEPVSGEVVLTDTNPLAVHCFSQACSLPEDACFFAYGGRRVQVLACGRGDVLDAEALGRPGPAPPGPTAVVATVDGKPLVVTPDAPLARSSIHPSHQCNGCSTAQQVYATAGPRAAVVHVDTWQAVQIDEESTSAVADAAFPDLPEPPQWTPCSTADALRNESRRRVGLGDEARITGDDTTAMNEYLAALSLDRCNPLAWANLGDMALRAGQCSVARTALEVAVGLLPQHYAAVTNLGRCYERLGLTEDAAATYRQALRLQPGYLPASQGLERLNSQ